MIDKSFVLFCVLISYMKCVEPKQSFLAEEAPAVSRRTSKNGLKEDIGQELKKALYTCASLSRSLGNLQQNIAALQTRLLSRVERLVENDRVFKKASRRELSQALKITSEVAKQLQVQEQNIVKLSSHMNKNKCLHG